MVSKVYFTDFKSRTAKDNKINKIKKLFKAANFKELMNKNELVAVKLHFGEKGNDSYINPVLVRQVVDKIYETGAKPFITDTNTLYFGSRHNSVDHIKTAILHGFDYAVSGAPLIIADGLLGNYTKNIKIEQKHFKHVKVAGDIENADSMIVMSHFKGHKMAGFGGAIKNLAMGCASVEGKIEQHQCVKPNIMEGCTSCGICINSCPVNALYLDEQGAKMDYDRCIGCNNCIDKCSDSLIEQNWENINEFTEKITEYALGAVKNKKGKIGYMNFLMNITPDCDCLPWSDRPIVPDIGILVSHDPVALDAASYDLVNQQKGFKNSKLHHHHHKGEDKFNGVWDRADGHIQINYGHKIGLGNPNYQLIDISSK
ncbi:MAG: DUF362 domain-containing protein [Methanobacterium sp.]|nr:DUF362 domain-containing protein [Methanobacterium sp.]